ncbi:MAG: hypothetical protein AAB474_00180 [Patescibacteria group bacterium]
MTEEFQKQLSGLPQDLRDAVFSEDVADKMMAIGKKYNLAIDKIGELNDETMNVIMGLTHPKNYIANLQKRLGLDAEIIKNLAAETNEQIFAPIKESLKKIHEIGGEKNFKSTPETKKTEEFKSAGGSPFEQKLEGEVFKPPSSIKKEVDEARKEQRYPGDADPYKEPVN